MLQELRERLPPSFNHLSRRDFLKLAGSAGGGLLALSGGLSWAYDIPPVHEEEVIPYPKPGWLETRHPNRPQLVEPEQGHKEFLRYMCLNDPLLKGIMTKAYTDLFNNPSDSPSKAGDAFMSHLTYAKEALKKEFHKNGGDSEPKLTDILHVAFYTFAAAYSPYFTYDDVTTTFGVKVDFSPSNDPLWWFEAKKNNAPRILPADKSQCRGSEKDVTYRCLGIDRIAHLAQHAFLTHMFMYSKNYLLQDADRMPNIVNFILNFEKDRDVQAKLLSELGGFMWEFKETFGERIKDENNQDIDAGLFDNTVRYDFAANNLGRGMAILLTRNGLSEDRLRERLDLVVNKLNDDEINKHQWKKEEKLPDIFDELSHDEVLYPYLGLLSYLSEYIPYEDRKDFVQRRLVELLEKAKSQGII